MKALYLAILFAAGGAAAAGCQKEDPTEQPAGGTGGTQLDPSKPDPPGMRGPEPGPIAARMVLEPFRAEDVTFARPTGMVRRDAPAGTYRFERETPSEVDANGFAFTYLGRIRRYQLPETKYLVERALAERKLTLVDKVQLGSLYAMATGDTGVPGPNRYVRILYTSRWDVVNESLAAIDEKIRGTIPDTLAAIAVELSGPTQEVLAARLFDHVIRSIAWSASVINDTVPADTLAGGNWHFGAAETTTESFGPEGELMGQLPVTDAFDVKFEPGNKFQLVTAMTVRGRRYITHDRYYVMGGVVLAYGRGDYRYENGVVTFAPTLCTAYTWHTSDPTTRKTGCHEDMLPVTLRLEQAEMGRIRINGVGSEPVTGWQYSFPVARNEAPGAWNVPKPPGNRVAGEPSGPINDKYNPCGIDEQEGKEGNDSKDKPTPYKTGETIQGCIASLYDNDFYEASPPPGDMTGGWVELAITDVGQGHVAVGAYEITATTESGIFAVDKSPAVPGQPLFAYWRALPGLKYRFAVGVKGLNGDPFSYKAELSFGSVVDANEPNNGDSQATPLVLGSPSTNYFFQLKEVVDYDYFKVPLNAGMVRVQIEDVPANIEVDFKLRGRELGVGQRGKPGASIDFTHAITNADTYTIQLNGWGIGREGVAAQRGEVPENFRKPYRITVTQP